MRPLLWLVLLSPLAFLLFRLFGTGADDPIKYIYTLTGASALGLLFATTSLTMLRKVINLVRYRRLTGLFAFFYASLHMLNFLILDMELDIAKALEETLDKPFVYLGMLSFLILLFMAITSLPRLFAKYARYHALLYAVLLMSSTHFIMAQKALSPLQWWLVAVMVIIGTLKVLQRTGTLKL